MARSAVTRTTRHRWRPACPRVSPCSSPPPRSSSPRVARAPLPRSRPSRRRPSPPSRTSRRCPDRPRSPRRRSPCPKATWTASRRVPRSSRSNRTALTRSRSPSPTPPRRPGGSRISGTDSADRLELIVETGDIVPAIHVDEIVGNEVVSTDDLTRMPDEPTVAAGGCHRTVDVCFSSDGIHLDDTDGVLTARFSFRDPSTRIAIDGLHGRLARRTVHPRRLARQPDVQVLGIAAPRSTLRRASKPRPSAGASRFPGTTDRTVPTSHRRRVRAPHAVRSRTGRCRRPLARPSGVRRSRCKAPQEERSARTRMCASEHRTRQRGRWAA